MIEIKYRGHLSKKQLLQLQEYLHKNGQLIYSGYEKVIYFDTSIFPQIGDFVTGYSRVSLKSDQRGTVLRIKEGNPSEPIRNKKVVSIKKSHCGNLIYILSHLGLKYGYYRPVHRQGFIFQNIRVAIKTKCVMGNHFEITCKKGVSRDDPRLGLLLKKFNLHFWSIEKYQERIAKKMKRFPEINLYETDIFK